MPSSMDEGKAWAFGAIRHLAPATILDVGPGQGTYRTMVGPGARWWAVEVWGPYVERYGLDDLYDRVIVADVRYLDWTALGRFDLVILGDVLEHMPREDALAVWERAREHAEWVLLSLPIVLYPQDAEEGNPYEAHRATWSHAECLGLPGIVDGEANPTVGVYLAVGSAVPA